jgi:ElaA protein
MTDIITWRWQHFEAFPSAQWHDVLRLRNEVFIIEQNCPYLDPDAKDPKCFHLTGTVGGRSVATLRAVPPCVSYAESSIGRVVVDPAYRAQGLGWELMRRGIAFNEAFWGTAIRISAQAYLEHFYQTLGFVTASVPYDEDGIPHIEMVRS